jgi:predicted RNA-binding protein with PIN domain
LKEYLIVDGYNVINGWDELKAESVHSLEVSRLKLLDIMSDYQGYIERYVAGLCKEDYITVATSDWVEQMMML